MDQTTTSIAIMFLLAVANTAQGRKYTIFVPGRVCCTPNGICPGPSAANAIARMICPNSEGGGNTTIGKSMTNLHGHYNMKVKWELADRKSVSLCHVEVNLSSCGTTDTFNDEKDADQKDTEGDGQSFSALYRILAPLLRLVDYIMVAPFHVENKPGRP